MSLRTGIVNLLTNHAKLLASNPIAQFYVGAFQTETTPDDTFATHTVTSDGTFTLNCPFPVLKNDSRTDDPRLIKADILTPPEAKRLETNTKRLLTLTDLAAGKFECEVALRSSLPDHTLDKLEDFSRGKLDTASLHLKGFPVCPQTDQLLLGTGQILGTCYVETSESDRIVQHISPKDTDATLQKSSSSKVPLYMHVENVGTQRVPDWVGIFCERNYERAHTTIVNPVDAMNQMLRDGLIDEVACLWEHEYWIQTPASFGEGRKRTYGHGVFSGDIARPNVTADFADMGSNSTDHANAFELFREYCQERAASVCLSPGDILFMRNTGPKDSTQNHTQCMHGRGQFEPHNAIELQRLLKRVFIEDRILSV